MAQIEQGLSARGVHVVTATTDDDGPAGRMDVPLGRLVPCNGAERIYFPRQTSLYKASLPFARWLWRSLAGFDAVHVHSLFSFAPVVAAAIAANRGVPCIIRPLGVLNHYGMQHRRSAFKALSIRMVEGPLLTRAAAVHFTSRQEQEEAETLGFTLRSRVIPLGISPLKKERSGAYEARFGKAGFPHLLFVSRIDRKKNLDVLLRAFALVLARYPQARLSICGDGDRAYLAEVRLTAEQLQVAPAVVWAGHVEGHLKASAFGSADVFVLPSFSENFGIAAVEALSAGLPCVLGRGVAVADEIQAAAAGIAVAPEAEAVASAICELVADDDYRARASQAARALARERYSPDAMIDGLCSLYAGITGSHSHRAQA
ncbi:hypothetical protein GCM10023332_01660 [Luteimonas vadosa]|uniref:Glycosyltransferase n=2 Tax=Luteimonas vadosa TaxID=1165507 RepID=A0ABP9DN65_9GAMM